MEIPSKQQLRCLWFKVHKWLGLLMALPVFLIFLSGSALVWKSSLDDLLHPSRRVDAAVSHDASFYLTAAEKARRPGEHVIGLTFPRARGPVVASAIGPAAPGMASGARYFLNPATGAVIERAPMVTAPLLFLHRLHGSLLLPAVGESVVGVIGLSLLLSAFSGLWLWWPTKPPFTRGMRWQRTSSTNANIHHQGGIGSPCR